MNLFFNISKIVLINQLHMSEIMEALFLVVTNVTDIVNFPKLNTSQNPLAMLEEFANKMMMLLIHGELSLKDFINMSTTCKTMQNYMKNVRYGMYNVNVLDYHVQKSIFRYENVFLYCVRDLRLVRRFLELFKYTYCIWIGYDVSEYYSDWNRYRLINYHGVTPLHICCFYPDRSKIAIEIIKCDPNSLDDKDARGDTPVVIAARRSYDTIKYIVENRIVDISQPIKGDMNALEVAFKEGNFEISELLLPYGHRKDVITGIYLSHGRKDQLKFLIRHPECIDVNTQGPRGYGIIEYLKIELSSPHHSTNYYRRMVMFIHSLTSK